MNRSDKSTQTPPTLVHRRRDSAQTTTDNSRSAYHCRNTAIQKNVKPEHPKPPPGDTYKKNPLTSLRVQRAANTILMTKSLPPGAYQAFDRIASRADVNSVNESTGSPALHFAASGTYSELTRSLLETGANVDQVNDYGSTALIMACYEGALDTIRILVENKANLEIQNSQGFNALMIATIYSSEDRAIEMMNVLLNAGSPVNAANKLDGNTALHYACRNLVRDLFITGDDEPYLPPKAKLLFTYGADGIKDNNNGDTALCMLHRQQDDPVIEALLALKPRREIG